MFVFFFSFCCLSLLLFSFVSSHQHSAAVSPPPYRDEDRGYFGPQAQKKISRGEIWAFQADKNKKKYTGPQIYDYRLLEKNNKNTQALRTTKQPPPAGHFTQGFGCQGHLLGVYRRKPDKNKKCFPGQSYSAWWVFPLLTHPWPL